MGLLLLYNFYYTIQFVYGKNVVATFFLLLFVYDNKESNNKEKETV